MQVGIYVDVCTTPNPTCLHVGSDGKSVQYKPTLEKGFPATELNIAVDSVFNIPQATPKQHVDGVLGNVASAFCTQSQNSVLYAYGTRGTPKRQTFFGESKKFSETPTPESGIIQHILHKIFSKNPEGVIQMCGFAVGLAESVVDLLNDENKEATLADSVKEGPQVNNLTRVPVDSYAAAAQQLKKAAQILENEFKSKSKGPLPPYDSRHIVFTILKTEDESDSSVEQNSIVFVLLGDCERPALCGLDTAQLKGYEGAHRTFSAVAGVLSAIRTNRLRLPFTKSKLTSVLKRPYNQEKHNPFNDSNSPTQSHFFAFVRADATQAEETYHVLTLVKRLATVLSGGVGPASRDLTAERWRLEQDIDELKEELVIARQAHEYKPCIYEQPKQIQSIPEEEAKRVGAILKKKEEAHNKARNEMREQAQRQAADIIAEEERKSNSNVQDMERQLADLNAQNAELTKQRDRKVKDFDKQLEKIRKKKVEEEQMTAKFVEEYTGLESEITERKARITEAQQRLTELTADKAHGRETIMKTRQAARSKRENESREHRQHRQQWLNNLVERNRKSLTIIHELTKIRPGQGIPVGVRREFESFDKKLRGDIMYVINYSPYVVPLDSAKPIGPKLEKMMEDYKKMLLERREKLDSAAGVQERRREQLMEEGEKFKSQLEVAESKKKQLKKHEAEKKDKHLEGLAEQVVQYLEHGCQMTKVPSKGSARRRYFFIAEDRKKLHSCELDEKSERPLNKKKPTTTVLFKDIKRVLLGQYSVTFHNYAARERRPPPTPEGVSADENPVLQDLSPTTLNKYFYRSLSFELKKGKTLDVVAETDSDFEAWVVALTRLTQRDGIPIGWGADLDVSRKPQAGSLRPEEAQLCRKHHILPQLYLSVKREVEQKGQNQFITVFDIRTLSTLDLPRAYATHAFFMDQKIIENYQHAR